MHPQTKQNLHSWTRSSTSTQNSLRKMSISGLDVAPIYINLLPSEILTGEIFPLVLEGAVSWLNTLLVLTSVCVHWRTLVNSTPQLWNKCIRIKTKRFTYLPAPGRREINRYLVNVETWLARSAPLPIPVSLDLYQLCVAPRWETLRIESRGRTEVAPALRALERIPEGTFQALIAAYLSLPFKVWPPIIPSAFASAPHLKCVELRVWTGDVELLPIPWTQLTHFSLACSEPRACLAAVAKCTNLISAVLECSSSPGFAQLATATLTHLSALRIRVSPALVHALDAFTSPP
ncbi:hypothetical protein B0H19DRAFT_1174822 [Mycena capillaripes]|nr:hypothetical protein B0H19DRAFT_1174822 [Mycena capillaripes]